jgi:PAS domain S-box-containing protein
MEDKDKTKEQLLEELANAHQRIDELVKREANYMQSGDEHEGIFNLTGYMICVASMDGYFLKINPTFKKVLGYSSTELLSKPFFDFIHPDDKGKTVAVIQENLNRGEEVIGFENRYRCKDGSYKWLGWTAHAVVEEGEMYAFAYDITERKQAEMKLRESERKYKDLQDASIDGHAWTDMEGHLIEVNDSYKKMMGYS